MTHFVIYILHLSCFNQKQNIDKIIKIIIHIIVGYMFFVEQHKIKNKMSATNKQKNPTINNNKSSLSFIPISVKIFIISFLYVKKEKGTYLSTLFHVSIFISRFSYLVEFRLHWSKGHQ